MKNYPKSIDEYLTRDSKIKNKLYIKTISRCKLKMDMHISLFYNIYKTKKEGFL
jgi:hypothetical protein